MKKHWMNKTEDGGTELVNMFPSPEGFVKVEEARFDAIVTQFIGYNYDEDGNALPIFATHIECKNMENLDILKEKSRSIFPVEDNNG